MKRILFIFCLISNYYVIAQTTIINEKYDKNNYPVNHFLRTKSNLYVISKGDKMGGLVKADEIHSMCIYDFDGTKKVLFDNKKIIGSYFSVDNKALLVTDISSGIFNSKSSYLIQDRIIELNKSDVKDLRNIGSGNAFFTFKNEFYLKNKKDECNVNLEKDDLFLFVKDISTRKTLSYKVKKPNLDKLVGTSFIKPKEDLGLKFIVNFDESLDLITKSISKDYSKSILYKTRLSNQGTVTNELVYEIKVTDHVLLYSRNYGGDFTYGGYDSKFLHFKDDLSINNYMEDESNGDIYIYGLYGDEFGKLNDMATPKGYYIFKFDRSGKKIWESINIIEDNDFNKPHTMSTIFVDLVQLNNNVCLTIRVNGLGDFFNYSLIDKTSGSFIKSESLEFKETFAHLNDAENNRYTINSNFKNLKELKNKKFDFNSIVAFNSNSKFAEYITSLSSKNDLNFYSSFSNKGIWLYESDDKEYFKVTVFN